jgi:hypothetical protein
VLFDLGCVRRAIEAAVDRRLARVLRRKDALWVAYIAGGPRFRIYVRCDGKWRTSDMRRGAWRDFSSVEEIATTCKREISSYDFWGRLTEFGQFPEPGEDDDMACHYE